MRVAYSQAQRVEAVRLFWKVGSATKVVCRWCRGVGVRGGVGSGWRWGVLLHPTGRASRWGWVGSRSWRRAHIRGCVLGVPGVFLGGLA